MDKYYRIIINIDEADEIIGLINNQLLKADEYERYRLNTLKMKLDHMKEVDTNGNVVRI